MYNKPEQKFVKENDEIIDSYLTGPCVAQNSSHVHRSVCHNRVVIELFLALCLVLDLFKANVKGQNLYI